MSDRLPPPYYGGQVPFGQPAPEYDPNNGELTNPQPAHPTVPLNPPPPMFGPNGQLNPEALDAPTMPNRPTPGGQSGNRR
ncbi:MAG TPA: hypothetical protein VLB73_00520 [Patescibacteria group bacterium]|nr:hypothetical protein [Patescibacteria group bacterium]